MQTNMTRAYALGLGYGSIWLVSACVAFGILDMINITTTAVQAALSILGVVLIGVALLFLCVRFLRLGYTLPKTSEGKISLTKRRIFLLLILLEIIGWAVLDTVLGQNHLQLWIVPINLIIIGAHFIPLAFVFQVRPYLVMGILWIVAIIGSIAILPPTLIIGHTNAWVTIPSLCCVGITWLTVLYLLQSRMGRLQQVAIQPV